MSTRRIQATLNDDVVEALELRARANNRSFSEELALQIHSRSPRAERLAQMQADVIAFITDLDAELVELKEATAKQFLRERLQTQEQIRQVEQLARGALNMTERVTVAQLSVWTGENWDTKTAADVGKALKQFSLERGDDPSASENKVPHPIYISINSYKPAIVREWLALQGQPIPTQLKYLESPAANDSSFFKGQLPEAK